MRRTSTESLKDVRSCYAREGSKGNITDLQLPVLATSFVPLIATDKHGLGFTIHGSLRDGVFIKEILSKGAAAAKRTEIAVGKSMFHESSKHQCNIALLRQATDFAQ